MEEQKKVTVQGWTVGKGGAMSLSGFINDLKTLIVKSNHNFF